MIQLNLILSKIFPLFIVKVSHCTFRPANARPSVVSCFPAKRRGWIARKSRNRKNPFVMQCNLKQKTKPYHLTHLFFYGEIALKALENITMLSAVKRSRDYRVLFGRAVMHLLLACQT